MKIGKILILPALLLAGVALFFSCSNILEPQVYNSLTPQNFFNSEADFNHAVAAIYNAFITDWGTTDQGANQWYTSQYNADPKSYVIRGEILTDEVSTSFWADYTRYTWGPATLIDDAIYAKIRYVARATDTIEKIQQSDADVPENIKDRYVAETKALRGWLMYAIYDFFGPVNVKLDPETLYDTEITPRLSHEEYVAAIERDLTEAIPDLADKYNGDADNWGRISKGVAQMVLLRLYMHEKEWAKAEAVGKDIMQMGYYLLPNYADVFKNEQNDEVIYAVPADPSSPNWYMMEVLPPNFKSTSDGSIAHDPGWYVLYMPWEFYDKYEEGDLRAATTIFDAYINTGGALIERGSSRFTGAIPMKYTVLEDGQGQNFDQVVFRYAEVLLSVAEAINEQRGPGEAEQYVNEVRRRAGVSDVTGLSKDDMRDFLLDERGRELYLEGARREDLIRHGKLIEYAQARGVSAQSHHVLFPIPEDVIIQGGGIIEQNPGYY
ncbi:RagB/SusD family nutrient uptake outer membrane protein [bacterium]